MHTGECNDGVCTCSNENYAGTHCEGNCTNHGGTAANRTTCASCTGLWIGRYCHEECDCNGRGTQTNITAARAAGCSAGSCECNEGFSGQSCERGLTPTPTPATGP